MYIGTDVTNDVFESQATRAARRLSTLPVPNRLRGVVGVYDVTDDSAPICDKTDLPGLCVAIGTSGNQFKNAPLVGGSSGPSSTRPRAAWTKTGIQRCSSSGTVLG
jgi:glycine/D-amino acid oxidase-like deaminating enzyme